MKKWVEYSKGRVKKVDIDRIEKCAQKFLIAYEKEKGGYGVEEVYDRFKPFLDRAFSREITEPVEDTPVTIAMRERQIPLEFEKVVMCFASAIESRPAVYDVLDPDTLMHHRDRYIKEKNGKTYILEYFEDLDTF